LWLTNLSWLVTKYNHKISLTSSGNLLILCD
jgi:hypothetical protein